MVIKWLDFKITQRCNNNCVYCGVPRDRSDANDILSADIIKKTIKEAIDSKFTHFAFLGGEPSLRDDFHEIFTPFHNGNILNVQEIMIISNMLRYNKEMIEALYSTRVVKASLTASIDNVSYPNYKNQDPEQVKSYLIKIQNLAKKYEMLGERTVQIHSVVSRENFKKIREHVRYFHDKGIDVSLAIVEPYIVCKEPKAYNEFTSDDFRLIISQLNDLEQEGKLNWANRVLKDYINEFIFKSPKKLQNCTAGRNHVIIEFDGNVYPCLTESYQCGLTFGNVQNTDFTKIYDSMQSFECKSGFHQTCWDHYLWSRLANEF